MENQPTDLRRLAMGNQSSDFRRQAMGETLQISPWPKLRMEEFNTGKVKSASILYSDGLSDEKVFKHAFDEKN